MAELNKERIFNESPKKVLIREYENLKQEYTKMNALKYKQIYENAPLSFILENSRYIFSEPIKGYDFYKNIIESSNIPFDMVEDELIKINEYFQENSNNMSDYQKDMYSELSLILENRYNRMRNSINLYVNMMENTESMIPYYDALYEYKKSNKIDMNIFDDLLTENTSMMDTINIVLDIPELHNKLLTFIESVYNDDPYTVEDYKLNTFTNNVIGRMMRDPYIIEKVNSLQNINLRHTISGLSNVDDIDTIDYIKTEKVINYDPHYSSPENSVNRLFVDDIYSEILQESNDEEKINHLYCEKAIVDINLGFTIIDSISDNKIYRNSIIEDICVESADIEKIPQNFLDRIRLLEEKSDNISNQIINIEEKYFSKNYGPGKIIAQSGGSVGNDLYIKNKKGTDNNYDYSPTRHITLRNKDIIGLNIDKQEVPRKCPKCGSKVIIKTSYSTNEPDTYGTQFYVCKNKKCNKNFGEIMPNAIFDYIDEATLVEEPEKRNIFQRIQNKAIDNNIKFKRKLSEAKRKSVDARNSGKAVAKIPMSVSNTIKKTMDEWDELDDDRRKSYMLESGVRKKYFRALKLAIIHYGAFKINPILNVVLLMSHNLSNMKNKRIRNEFIKEYKTEIEVINEKIKDAENNGDTHQKYELMRLKAKFEAELDRIGTNSKFI